eukprot:543311_1
MSQLTTATTLYREIDISDNEFGNDASSRASSLSLNDETFFNSIDLAFDLLQKTNEMKLKNTLTNRTIIFDSLMRVYSPDKETYVDVAGILTKSNLYFISAINYQTWQQFRDRSKINELDNDQKIDDKIAMKLIKNLELFPSENKSMNKNMMDYLISKTPKQIKINILAHKNRSLSMREIFTSTSHSYYKLSTLSIQKAITETYTNDGDTLHTVKCDNIESKSGNDNFEDIKNINCIVVDGFFNENIIEPRKRNDFIAYILGDIEWIDEDQRNASKIIVLRKYYSNSIIALLNNRARKYFELNETFNKRNINISAYFPNKIEYIHNDINVLELEKLNIVKPLTSKSMPYGFVLESTQKSQRITCQLDSNNSRFEWITHLEYVINYAIETHEIKTDSSINSNTAQNIDKLMNDFANKNSEYKE